MFSRAPPRPRWEARRASPGPRPLRPTPALGKRAGPNVGCRQVCLRTQNKQRLGRKSGTQSRGIVPGREPQDEPLRPGFDEDLAPCSHGCPVRRLLRGARQCRLMMDSLRKLLNFFLYQVWTFLGEAFLYFFFLEKRKRAKHLRTKCPGPPGGSRGRPPLAPTGRRLIGLAKAPRPP